MRMFKILKAFTNSSQHISLSNDNFASVICNLLSFSATTFRFEVFYTENTTSQVFFDGFKVSVVRLKAYLHGMTLSYVTSLRQAYDTKCFV